MRKTDPYKIIKQLLEGVHLKPRKKDWEQMQAMLNKELPLPKTTKWFKPVHYFFAATVAVVITTTVIVLKHQHALVKHTNENNISVKNKNENGNTLNKDGVLNNSTGENNKTSKDTATKNEALKNYSVKNDSVGALSMQANNNNTVKQNNNNSTEENTQSHTAKNNDVVNYNQQHEILNEKNGLNDVSQRKKENKKDNVENKKQHDFLNIKNDSSKFVLREMNRASSQQKINGTGLATKQDNSITENNNASVPDQNKNGLSKFDDKSVITDSNNVQHTIKISTADVAQSIAKTNANTNQSILKKQKGGNDKQQQKNVGGFNYGLQISPLQYFPDADKKISGGYVPGLFGEYLFTKNIGVHIDVSPYMNSNIKNTQIFTDSASNNDTVLNTTYYLSQLHTVNAALSLVYKHNHVFVEAGVGLQSLLGGKGKLISNNSFDSTGFSTTSSKVFYHNNDVAFKTVNKSMLNYQVNLFYDISQWQIGVGYYQHAKGWIKNNAAKATGSVQFQLRYTIKGKNKSKP